MRPRLTERGPLAIVKGRHPLLEQQPGMDYQPNDTYLSGVPRLKLACLLLKSRDVWNPSVMSCAMATSVCLLHADRQSTWLSPANRL